ncbi:hypothetical protein H8356DRAFT_1684714 [Neocallimastix lanati (nom. inval.)]|nr:hypothetical protein H8356DRAFT_1684714 [Neocallimastix sp. JGI-2020a]
MLSSNERICALDENFVSKKRTVFQIENSTKLLYKINYKVYNKNGKELYQCEKGKFCDVIHDNVIFEYEKKNHFTSIDLIIQKSNSSYKVIFKKKFGNSIDIVLSNEALNETANLKMKGHFLKNNFEIYNQDNSSLLCSFKKNGIFSKMYTIEVEKGVDSVLMMMIVFILINMIQRTRTAAASSAAAA